MRFAWLALATLLAASPANAQRMLVLGAGGSFAGYQGPGDIVASATAWYGLRGYSAAYASPGTGKSVNVRRASDNSTQDIVILSNGNFDVAGYNTFVGTDATGTCTIATTTLSCTGLGSALHNADPITGAGITNPCILSAVGSLVGGAQTATAQIAGTSTSCGTVSVGETVVAQVVGFSPEAYDQSGNLFHVTQGTAGNQPQLLPLCLASGTLPCLYYTGSDALTKTSGVTTLSQPFSRQFVAERLTAVTSFQLVIADTNTSTGFYSSANNIYAGCNTNINKAANDSTPHSVMSTCNGASTIIYVDGTSNTVSAGGTGTAATIGFGSSSTGTLPLGGYLAQGGEWPGAFGGATNKSLCTNDNTFYSLGFTCN